MSASVVGCAVSPLCWDQSWSPNITASDSPSKNSTCLKSGPGFWLWVPWLLLNQNKQQKSLLSDHNQVKLHNKQVNFSFLAPPSLQRTEPSSYPVPSSSGTQMLSSALPLSKTFPHSGLWKHLGVSSPLFPLLGIPTLFSSFEKCQIQFFSLFSVIPLSGTSLSFILCLTNAHPPFLPPARRFQSFSCCNSPDPKWDTGSSYCSHPKSGLPLTRSSHTFDLLFASSASSSPSQLPPPPATASPFPPAPSYRTRHHLKGQHLVLDGAHL